MDNVYLKKTGLFFIASCVGGIIAIFISILILGDTDPKFSDAPSMEFGIEIFGFLIISFISALAYLISIFLSSSYSSFHILSDKEIVFAGLVYFPFLLLFTVILKFIVDVESMIFVIITWSVLMVYPIIIGFISNQSLKHGSAQSAAP
jgi:hypothetical protein